MQKQYINISIKEVTANLLVVCSSYSNDLNNSTCSVLLLQIVPLKLSFVTYFLINVLFCFLIKYLFQPTTFLNLPHEKLFKSIVIGVLITVILVVAADYFYRVHILAGKTKAKFYARNKSVIHEDCFKIF